jgi:hypothetical protein
MHGNRHVWLGLTPEPERELPIAVATLRARQSGAEPRQLSDWIHAESKRIESLILHGTQRSWLRYLRSVTELVTHADEGSAELALQAGETVLEHHRMLIGLPGSGYEASAPEREALTRIVAELRSRP